VTDEQRRQGCPAGDLCIGLLRRDTDTQDVAILACPSLAAGTSAAGGYRSQ